MKLRIKNTALTIKILGWMQIIGGVFGIGVVSYILIRLNELNGTLLFIILTGYSLFAFAITAGTKLLTKDGFKLGMVLSIINYSLQVFQLKMFGYGLTFTTGSAFSIGYEKSIKFNFEIISSQFSMAINSDPEFIYMINLVAILVIYVLLDIWNETIVFKKLEAERKIEKL